MSKVQVTIEGRDGLNLLKAARMARSVRQLRSVVVLKCGQRLAGAHNILSILALCAALGSPVEIEAYGQDCQQAVAAVEQILGERGDQSQR